MYAVFITYAVFANTPIGDEVFVLKLGDRFPLSGSQAAKRVVDAEDGNVEPAGTFNPEPSAAVFHPANL